MIASGAQITLNSLANSAPSKKRIVLAVATCVRAECCPFARQFRIQRCNKTSFHLLACISSHVHDQSAGHEPFACPDRVVFCNISGFVLGVSQGQDQNTGTRQCPVSRLSAANRLCPLQRGPGNAKEAQTEMKAVVGQRILRHLATGKKKKNAKMCFCERSRRNAYTHIASIWVLILNISWTQCECCRVL